MQFLSLDLSLESMHLSQRDEWIDLLVYKHVLDISKRSFEQVSGNFLLESQIVNISGIWV